MSYPQYVCLIVECLRTGDEVLNTYFCQVSLPTNYSTLCRCLQLAFYLHFVILAYPHLYFRDRKVEHCKVRCWLWQFSRQHVWVFQFCPTCSVQGNISGMFVSATHPNVRTHDDVIIHEIVCYMTKQIE